MRKPLVYLLPIATVAAILLAACIDQRGPVIVASKTDAEGALLSQMMVLMLRDSGIEVRDRPQFGPAEVVREALLKGEISMYPEYTGNGALFFDEADSDVWNDLDAGYERVRELDERKNDVIWLRPAPASNTWAIAVTETLAEQEGIKTLEDFAAYVDGGGQVKLAGSEELLSGPAALPAFQRIYGFELKDDQLLTLAGGGSAQAAKAAADGGDGVNGAMVYGTDGSLSALGLLVLEDTRGAQPVYAPSPTVMGSVMAEYPVIKTILAPVFESLDLQTLQRLNAKVAVGGEDPRDAAREYLESKGFLAPSG